MQQRLELLLGCGIGEHQLPHARAVHGPARIDVSIAEQPPYLLDGHPTGARQLVRNRIRVDHRCAEPGELFGRCALAATDATGQADDEGHSL